MANIEWYLWSIKKKKIYIYIYIKIMACKTVKSKNIYATQY